MMRAPRSGEDLIITHTQSLDCQDTVDLLVCRHWFLQGKLLRGGAWAGPLEPPALGMPVVQVYQAIVNPYRSVGEVIEENCSSQHVRHSIQAESLEHRTVWTLVARKSVYEAHIVLQP